MVKLPLNRRFNTGVAINQSIIPLIYCFDEKDDSLKYLFEHLCILRVIYDLTGIK
jgi:hypothetical protein